MRSGPKWTTRQDKLLSFRNLQKCIMKQWNVKSHIRLSCIDIQTTEIGEYQNKTTCLTNKELKISLSSLLPFYLVNTLMRSKRDIKKGRLGTPGGFSPRNCRWGCDVLFLKIVTLFQTKTGHFPYVYTPSWFPWKPYPISDKNGQHHIGFLTKRGSKSLVFGVAPAYIANIGEYPPGNVSIWCKFPQGIWNSLEG